MLMFLNGVAGSEVFVILLFVLVFFGAKSIPGLSRSLGRSFRQLKDASQEIQNEISRSTQNIKKDLNLEERSRNIQDSINKPLDQIQQDIEQGLEGGVAHTKPPRQYTQVNPTPDSSTTLDQPEKENDKENS